MIVDTSALIAIVRDESDAAAFVRAIATSRIRPGISSVTLVEAGLVLNPAEFEDLLADILDFEIFVVEFTVAVAHLAIEAGHRYGKGRGKKAQLNFGDCCSYATAKALNMPLLFKGIDFLHTDIEPVRM